jgi:CRISPR/Cas system-associated protein Cas10 (large subunit of type III CRISPR-Cas system)
LESYEGIFDSGGKREYKKYERSNPHFKNEFNETPGGLADIDNAVLEELKSKGLNASELLRADPNQRIREYKEIAQSIGLKGMKKQGDTFGLIELILKKLNLHSLGIT